MNDGQKVGRFNHLSQAASNRITPTGKSALSSQALCSPRRAVDIDPGIGKERSCTTVPAYMAPAGIRRLLGPPRRPLASPPEWVQHTQRPREAVASIEGDGRVKQFVLPFVSGFGIVRRRGDGNVGSPCSERHFHHPSFPDCLQLAAHLPYPSRRGGDCLLGPGPLAAG
jgi:hypothetical protein